MNRTGGKPSGEADLRKGDYIFRILELFLFYNKQLKETVVEPVETMIEDMKETVDKAKLADEMAKGRKQAEKERKKEERQEEKEDRKDALLKPVQKAKAAKMNIVFQSPMGGSITPEEVAKKVPKGCTDVYVRIDENKIYWVKKEETGSVDIW